MENHLQWLLIIVYQSADISGVIDCILDRYDYLPMSFNLVSIQLIASPIAHMSSIIPAFSPA